MGTMVNYSTAEVFDYAKFDLGYVFTKGGKKYKFVKYVDAVDVTAGMSLQYANTAMTEVTPDLTGGSDISIAAGVATAAVDVSETFVYGWMLIQGLTTVALTTAGSVAEGGTVVVGTSDGAVAAGAGDGSDLPLILGVATQADSTNTLPIGGLYVCPMVQGG